MEVCRRLRRGGVHVSGTPLGWIMRQVHLIAMELVRRAFGREAVELVQVHVGDIAKIRANQPPFQAAAYFAQLCFRSLRRLC